MVLRRRCFGEEFFTIARAHANEAIVLCDDEPRFVGGDFWRGQENVRDPRTLGIIARNANGSGTEELDAGHCNNFFADNLRWVWRIIAAAREACPNPCGEMKKAIEDNVLSQRRKDAKEKLC